MLIFERIICVFQVNKSLQSLNLYNNKIGPDGARALGDALKAYSFSVDCNCLLFERLLKCPFFMHFVHVC